MMGRKLAVTLGILLLLALVAKPIWLGREQWHIGQGSDDAVYWLTAKAIATGQGYVVPSLPSAPYAVKYPPLYPAFLSLAWRIGRDFPASLRIAAIMQALLLPIFLALLLQVLRGFAFSWRRAFLVAAITTVTLQVVMVTIMLFSELLSLCLLLASILAAERSVDAKTRDRDGVPWALAAGLLAGLAYLTRNALLPLLGAAPLFFLMRRKPRQAVCFLLLALPLAASWHIWTFLHGPVGPDATNASYFNEYVRIIRVHGFWANFMKQLAAISDGVAENGAPGLVAISFGLPIYHLPLAAAIFGGIRIGRRCGWPLYLIFSALYCAMMLVWWFEGMGRLILPAWPALVAGIAEEAAHLATLFKTAMARSPFWSVKSPTWRTVPRWVLIGLGLATVVRNDSVTWSRVESAMTNERHMRMEDEIAFDWIAKHKADDTIVLAHKDTTTFLYTGAVASKSLFIAVTPHGPEAGAFATSFATLPSAYARGLLLILRSDFGDGFSDGGMDAYKAAGRAVAGSKLEFATPGALIYSFPIPR
jgi:hypothetical protein